MKRRIRELKYRVECEALLGNGGYRSTCRIYVAAGDCWTMAYKDDGVGSVPRTSAVEAKANGTERADQWILEREKG